MPEFSRAGPDWQRHRPNPVVTTPLQVACLGVFTKWLAAMSPAGLVSMSGYVGLELVSIVWKVARPQRCACGWAVVWRSPLRPRTNCATRGCASRRWRTRLPPTPPAAARPLQLRAVAGAAGSWHAGHEHGD